MWFDGEDTGMAHGAAGVLVVSPQPELAGWLLEQPYVGQQRQGWCYGVPGIAWALWTAGVLLIADAFVREGVSGAVGLRDLMFTYLTDRLDLLRDLDDALLLGAPGVLAALLTGADRTWLRCLGLR